jgi:squalene-hopene/tetraprenyl-beta-curcumene cyclase
LEKVPFADHNAMLDPECADIAARILEVLGDENFSQDHPQVSKAIDFLWQTQEEDGSWYGRWGVNYIYGTWQVLRGLNALDVDMSLPQLMKSRDWLESIQLEDGGWGERCDTYDDPINKGKGPSTASQSAWALMGLIAFNDMDRPSIRRGVNYLMEQQNTDGTWDEDEITGTGFPKVFYLKYDLYRISWPLLALASYRNALTRRKIRSDEKIETVAVLTEK